MEHTHTTSANGKRMSKPLRKLITAVHKANRQDKTSAGQGERETRVLVLYARYSSFRFVASALCSSSLMLLMPLFQPLFLELLEHGSSLVRATPLVHLYEYLHPIMILLSDAGEEQLSRLVRQTVDQWSQ